MARTRWLVIFASAAAALAGHGPAMAQAPVFTDVTPLILSDPGSWGEGVAWGDYDGDGDLDLLVSNEGQHLRFYRNNGGTFTIGYDFGAGNWTGVALADYDNDGDLDLYAAQATTPKHLYRNDGGTFTDVTAGELIDNSHAHGVAWSDIDRDGDVDLFYAIAFPPPEPTGRGNRLMRNDGGATFTDITPPSLNDPQYGKGCSFADYDLDGDDDLLVSNFTITRLYRNDGGSFTDVTTTPLSSPGHAGAIAWGDADNDGDYDLAITKAFSSSSRVYRNDGGVFVDVTPPALAVADSGAAVAWIDFDLDADLDLFIASWNTGTTRLYRNDGNFGLTDVANAPLTMDVDPHGVAWGDYDNDGDLDVFYATYWGKPDHLLRNDTVTDHHWLQVELVGVQSNRSGIGARVEVVTGALRQARAIVSGESYNSMNSLRAHFGLANEAIADSIVVRWPSGIVQRLTAIWGDQVLTILERDVTTDVEGRASGPRLRVTPNPMSGAGTRLTFTIAADARVMVRIHDVQGRELRVLEAGPRAAGVHETSWDGRDAAGRVAPPGLYLARVEVEGEGSVRRSSWARIVRL